MRRKDREVTDLSEICRIIDSCDCCRLGLVDNGEAYIVPLNFGYEIKEDSISLYFHSAKEGRKISLLENNPIVSFEMDTEHHLKEGNRASEFSFFYESVMGKGKIEALEDREDKKHGLSKVMEHYTNRKEWDFDEKALNATAVLKLSVMEISAKANKNH